MEFNEESFVDGNLLLINKPLKWTSFQVVNKINPLGLDYGTEKVVRGGSWFSNDVFCDISRRYKLKPDYRDTNFGFRCVKDI